MRKRQSFETVLEGMLFGGRSYSTVQDKKIVFKGGITGQKIKGMVKRFKNDITEGKILQTLEPSALESAPNCGHFPACGGCSMLTVPYALQLALKRQQLLELFHSHGHNEITDLEVLPAPLVYEYKNKMEYTFGDLEKDGPLQLGLHMRSNPVSILHTDHCLIVDADYRLLLEAVQRYFQDLGLPKYNSLSKQGYLRHFVIRKGFHTQELLLNLVTTSAFEIDQQAFVSYVLALPLKARVTGILHTHNDSLSDAVIPEKVTVLYGKETYEERVLAHTFTVSAFSFFQTNTRGAETLYQSAIDMIPTPRKTIFDLYSGTGTIGILLAGRAQKVYGIEIIEEAVEQARANAKRNGIQNITFLAGDVAEQVLALPESPDLIVLDPPRAGLHPKAMKDVLSFEAPEILYISCNPEALARDLKHFKKAGYFLRDWKAVDMFAHTPHVETIVRLSREES